MEPVTIVTVVLLAGIPLAVLLFLVLRYVVLWYWRVNDIVGLLEQLVEATGKVPKTRARDSTEGKPWLGPSTSAADGGAGTSVEVDRKSVVVCRRCGSFKPTSGYCPECKSGWAGGQVRDTLWAAVLSRAKTGGVPVADVLKATVVCRKCHSLRNRGKPCDACGAA